MDKSNSFDTANIIYYLLEMKITPIDANRVFSPAVPVKYDGEDTSKGATVISISQLYEFVKTYGNNFYENSAAVGGTERLRKFKNL